MIGFILVISIAALIGLQLGIYSVLKMKGISSGRSLLYTFFLYLIPVVLIVSHVNLYKDRYSLLKEAKNTLKLTDKQYRHLMTLLDRKRFAIVTTIGAIVDIFKIKDNLKILIDFVLEYDKKVLVKNTVGKTDLIQQVGLIGVIAKILKLVSIEMRDQAMEETLVKRYAY
jgi:hypothetical protein